MAESFQKGIGADAVKTDTPNEFRMDSSGRTKSIIIAAAARDDFGSPAHSPTTTLRKGLVMGKITSGGQYAEYDDGAGDGTETAVGILLMSVNLLNESGTAVASTGALYYGGYVDQAKLHGHDANGKADLAAVAAGGMIFKEDIT